MSESFNKAIDQVFRREYSKLVSFLTVKFGASNIDLIEDAVQEALYKAMQIWPFKEVPKEPGKWLFKVAHNKLIDELRRSKKFIFTDDQALDKNLAINMEVESGVFADNQLKMIFACCHPKMKESEQIMLCLKLLSGFSNKEIGRALLKNETAIKKAITRAKTKFKSLVSNLEIPQIEELTERMSSVLKVIYLMFNNGYTASDGDQVLKKDVCQEAIGLGELLYQSKDFNTPELRAILALMYFNISRFDSRIDESGAIITMEYQNREKWNKHLILTGLKYFNESAEGDYITKYHFESAIAREHIIAPTFESTDWQEILKYYNYLISMSSNPILELNMLVALSHAKGPAIALAKLKTLDPSDFQNNHHYFAIKADFEKKLGKKTYTRSLKKAIQLTNNLKEKELLFSKM